MIGHPIRNAFIGAVLLFLLAPLVVVAGVSINLKKSLAFPPRGISLNWYQELFTSHEWWAPAWHSVLIALVAAAIAVTIALPLAHSLWRTRGRYVQALFYIGLAPSALPPVILAIGFLGFWASIKLYGQLIATILSHAIFLVPLPLVMILLGLRSIHPDLIEAASTLGANQRTIFWTITLPLIRPFILAGYAFAFVLSLNEYIIAFSVAGFTVETLPIKIFNSLHYGYTPVMACITVVFVGLAIAIFSLIHRFIDLSQLIGGSHERRG